jgi:hypothetical protein
MGNLILMNKAIGAITVMGLQLPLYAASGNDLATFGHRPRKEYGAQASINTTNQ